MVEKNEASDEDPYFRSLRFNFNDWNLGGKLIFISVVLAIISQILPWIKGESNILGYQQGASVFLALYIYPFFILAMDKSINKIAGYTFGGLIVVLPSYFLYYMSGEMAAPMLEIMGFGMILFMFSGILLIAGVYDYKRYLRDKDKIAEIEEESEEKEKKGKPCPECDSPMEYVDDWDRWYCENCDEYK